MSIDMNNFIIKNKRKYFKCCCDQCGKERGYFHKEKANLLCQSCGGKKSSITGWITRGCTSQCSRVGCDEPHSAKGLCHIHYLQLRRQQSRIHKKLIKEQYLLSNEYKEHCQQQQQRKQKYKQKWYSLNRIRIQQKSIEQRLKNNARCRLYRKKITNRIAHNIR